MHEAASPACPPPPKAPTPGVEAVCRVCPGKPGREILATSSFKVGGQPPTSNFAASSPAEICPITGGALAAVSSTAFLSGDPDVTDFGQHFDADPRKVLPL